MRVNSASAGRRIGFLIGEIRRLAARGERGGRIGQCDHPRVGRGRGVFLRPGARKAPADLSRRVATMRQETFAGRPASSHEVRFDDLQPIKRHLLTSDSCAQRSSFP